MAHGEAAWHVCLPRGDLIHHVAPPANPHRFACMYSFFTQFSRQLLGAFWYLKWVIRGTVGNLEESTFQRYKVCMNRSSDGNVMALGSRGVRVVFLRFSGEDSSQTRDTTDKPRVTSRSQSCSLSQVSELADQLAASWKEFAHEGDCSRRKTHQIFSTFSLFLSVFARTVDIAPNVDFRHSWCP